MPRGKPFRKGQSGNPGGRPKEVAEVRELARKHGPDAIKKLAALLKSKDERVVLGAVKELLDRGYGKSAQAITGEGGEEPVAVTFTMHLHPGVRKESGRGNATRQ